MGNKNTGNTGMQAKQFIHEFKHPVGGFIRTYRIYNPAVCVILKIRLESA